MLQTQSLVAPAAQSAAHLLPGGAVLVVGAALLLEITAWQAWKKHRLKRQLAEQKQAELEKKVEELQNQYQSLKAMLSTAQPTAGASYTPNKGASSKHALFQQIINENVAIREAANA